MPDLRRQAPHALHLPVSRQLEWVAAFARNSRPTSSEYARRMSRQEFVSLMRARGVVMNNADERMRGARVWLRHHCIVPEFEGEMADGKRKFKRWFISRETLAIPVAQQVMAKLGGGVMNVIAIAIIALMVLILITLYAACVTAKRAHKAYGYDEDENAARRGGL